ncbi:hypothetical protein F5Y18DRAFT_436620 [Xylariaceae sp. FL1019]|nr:hypothetical protein F5Y18DRAFT_436620 [Xylariaceae sp. FL1019]
MSTHVNHASHIGEQCDKGVLEAPKCKQWHEQTKIVDQSLVNLIATAQEQSEILKDKLALSLNHAVYFSYIVNGWFWSRAKVIADENGRKQQVTDSDSDKAESAMQAMEFATQSSIIWIYICHTLEAYRNTEIKAKRLVLLQELANVCQYEYRSKQRWLERHVSVTRFGQTWYRKVGTPENGDEHVKLKKGVILPKDCSQTSCLLRLCQFNVKVEQAQDLLHKIEALQTMHVTQVSGAYEYDENTFSALDDLSVIVAFTSELRQALPMPSAQVKKPRGFLGYMHVVEEELDTVRARFDSTVYGLSMLSLCEPPQFQHTIQAFCKFYASELGQDLVRWHTLVFAHCIGQILEPWGEGTFRPSHVEDKQRIVESSNSDQKNAACNVHGQRDHYAGRAQATAQSAQIPSREVIKQRTAKTGLLPFDQHSVGAKSRRVSAKKPLEEYIPLPSEEPEQPELSWRAQEKRCKEKTRTSPSLYTFDDLVPSSDEDKTAAEPVKPRRVDAATAAVFEQLFQRSEARGPLAWTTFCKAMTSKGVRFTLVPTGGSKIRFTPPKDEPVQKPIQFHKFHGPHGGDIPPYAQLA